MIRTAQIYVQASTVRRLRLVTKLYPARNDSAPSQALAVQDRLITIDEQADKLLNEAIAECFPLILEMEADIKRLDKQLEKEYQQRISHIKTMKEILSTCPKCGAKTFAGICDTCQVETVPPPSGSQAGDGSLDPLVIPFGGAEMTPEQAAVALREAMQIIESVGTTGIYGKEKTARDWMRTYFPAYAEAGTW